MIGTIFNKSLSGGKIRPLFFNTKTESSAFTAELSRNKRDILH